MRITLFKGIGTILMTLLLVSCATERNYSVMVRSWQTGQSYALLNKWGYPDKIENLSNGDRRFIYYAKQRADYKTGCTTWFDVNRHSKIVHSGYRGHFCRASSSFLKTMGNSARTSFM